MIIVNKREKYAWLSGVIAPVVTPWTEDERLDENAFKAQVRYVLDAGVNGISPAGSTGEGAMIHDDERNRMISIIQEENKGRVPVVAGIIRHSTRDAVKAATEAKQSGADALMITPIQYLGGTDAEGNKRFYRAISDSVDLPIIIYNVVPQNEISPRLAYDLLDIENVVGVKQSCGGVNGFVAMQDACGGKGLIYAATDELMYTTYTLGADGAIAAILGLFPKACVRLWELRGATGEDAAEALELQRMIYSVWMKIIGDQFPRRMKAALEMLGRDCGISMSPLNRSSDDERCEIEWAVERYKKYAHSASWNR